MTRHIPFLFLSGTELKENKLAEDNFHHLVKVLRFKKADLFVALDNTGNKFDCSLAETLKNSAEFVINKQYTYKKPEFSLVLVQGLTKPETFEEIINKAVQLGVNRIIPLNTKNSTVAVDLYKKKKARFDKIVKSAAEQSQRIFLPVLEEVANFTDFFGGTALADSADIIVAYEKAELPMKTVLKKFSGKNITLVCGPEGGFSEAETGYLKEKQIPLVSLGKNILRAETAVIAGLGNIIYELSEII